MEQVTNSAETLSFRKVQWAVWSGLALITLSIIAAFVLTAFKRAPLPVYSSIPPFTLTNQDGHTVTLDDLRGQVWIADAIFTRCPGQCLLMSAHMKQLQENFPPGQPIRLVSLTTDPGFDQPAVLKKYAERFSAQDNRWTFLTGDKTALHTVEIDGLKLSVVDKPAGQQENSNDLFIHSEKFVLIDKQGRIRAWHDGQEDATLPQIIAEAESLARE